LIELAVPLIHEEFFKLNGQSATVLGKVSMDPPRELSSAKFDVLPYIQITAQELKGI
jgi:hypothetical protein